MSIKTNKNVKASNNSKELSRKHSHSSDISMSGKTEIREAIQKVAALHSNVDNALKDLINFCKKV